ncbi:MAG: hypothetical protein M0Q26_13005 [Chitinophagaceae bacterium]|nr:hypothetical protein [Chitinophagaceae bacterium]
MKMLKSILLQDNSPPIGKFTNHNKLNTSIMKQTFLFLILATSFLTAKSQLNKGNWLVGGTGKFYSYNSEYSSATYNTEAKYTQIDLSPSVGYFVIDKLAFGLRPTFSSIKGKVIFPGGLSTNVQRYWIGPFSRYYFLNNENNYNIVADLSYQFGFFGGGLAKGHLSTFSALAGPVIYFNTSVGIEFLLGYSYSKEDVEQGNKEIRKGFQIGIGLQIHLEK